MKVLQLLDELEEIIESSPNFPLTGKILVDAEDILELIKEIRIELPEEIQRAQWINEERQRLLSEAQNERDVMIKEARVQAESLVDNDDITVRAKAKAEEIIRSAEMTGRSLKLGSFEYVDNILYSFQERMDQLNHVYFEEMFNGIQKTFDQINGTVASNRNEIKELIYKAQMGGGADLPEDHQDEE